MRMKWFIDAEYIFFPSDNRANIIEFHYQCIVETKFNILMHSGWSLCWSSKCRTMSYCLDFYADHAASMTIAFISKSYFSVTLHKKIESSSQINLWRDDNNCAIFIDFRGVHNKKNMKLVSTRIKNDYLQIQHFLRVMLLITRFAIKRIEVVFCAMPHN